MRTLLRISSNYARMVGTFLFGLWLIRLLLGFGADAYGVILLLGAGQGITAILKDMARASIVPALGAAWHSEQGRRFPGAYNSSLLVCLLATLVTAIGFAGLAAALPCFAIPAELLEAAHWFVTLKALQGCLTLLLSPAFYMYIVAERMVAYNSYVLLDRVGETLAALIVLALVPAGDSPAALVQYGIWSTGLCLGVTVIAVALIVRSDRRLRPRPGLVSRDEIRAVLGTGRSNSLIVLANNLYFRTDALIVNAFFGLFGNVVFGIASQFVSYTRTFAMGLVTGLDAVSARIASSRDGRHLRILVHQSTRAQGVVTFPVAMTLLFLTEPLIRLWLGPRLEDPTRTLPAIVTTVRILIIGLAARSAGDAWIGILSGAGKLRVLARIVVCSGIANVALVVLLASTLPAPHALQAPAWAYTPLSLLVYGVLTPLMLRRQLGVAWSDIYRPLLKPLTLAMACGPILLAVHQVGTSVIALASVIAAYGAAYLVAGIWWLLTPDERLGLRRFLARRRSSAQVISPEVTNDSLAGSAHPPAAQSSRGFPTARSLSMKGVSDAA